MTEPNNITRREFVSTTTRTGHGSSRRCDVYSHRHCREEKY